METFDETELAIEEFLNTFRRWLVLQPAWALMMGGQDRATRRRVAKLLADEIVTIPVREDSGGTANRTIRRASQRELARQEREWYKGVER